jgi:hypothetical protein
MSPVTWLPIPFFEDYEVSTSQRVRRAKSRYQIQPKGRKVRLFHARSGRSFAAFPKSLFSLANAPDGHPLAREIEAWLRGEDGEEAPTVIEEEEMIGSSPDPMPKPGSETVEAIKSDKFAITLGCELVGLGVDIYEALQREAGVW